MPPIIHRRNQRSRISLAIPSIPALFRPGPNYEFPVILEDQVLARLLLTRLLQFRDLDQLKQIMCMAALHSTLVGEFSSAGIFRNASLKPALHRVSRQIKRAIE